MNANIRDILALEDEADIRQQINKIMAATPGLDQARVEELVRVMQPCAIGSKPLQI